VGGSALDLLAKRNGCGLIRLSTSAILTGLELLEEGIGTAVSITPTGLRRLLELAHEHNIDLKKTNLRFGFIGAERAEEPFRNKVLAELPDGFSWIELYGLTETGGPSVAFGPNSSAAELKLNTQDYVVEILDPRIDQQVPFGEIGELTLTTRRINGRTPLIRYRTRDLVRAIAGTAKAPTYISRILGRVDEALKFGGILVYPSAIAEIMSEYTSASSEWRAWIQEFKPDHKLLIEAETSPQQCQLIKKAFKDRLGLDLSVTPTKSGILEREDRKTRHILIESH
jgi:phenylacetate-coenzyme A ligase PaaK-like adenylate-forming protein